MSLLILLSYISLSYSYLYGDIQNSYCWVTLESNCQTNGTAVTTCITQLEKCPDALVMTWMQGLPAIMDDATTYDVTVNISLPNSTFDVTSIPTFPHFNIHACRESVGACTPLLTDVPNLVTTTTAKSGNFTFGTNYAIFNQTVHLPSGNWWVIAHVKFTTANPSQSWQACIGYDPTIVPAVPTTDLFETALITMFSIFVFVVAIYFVSRRLKKKKNKKLK